MPVPVAVAVPRRSLFTLARSAPSACLRLECDGCKRSAAVEVNAQLDVLTLPPDMPLWQIASRLRCSALRKLLK